MVGNEFLARDVLGHGAYLCLRRTGGGAPPGEPGTRLMALAARLGLVNEFDPGGPPPRESIALLRRQRATPGDLADDGVLHADAVVHVASREAQVVDEFCAEATRLLETVAGVRRIGGVVGAKNYTGAAMNNWAYARAVVQQPGPAMPSAFLVPMSKTPAWWRMGWMERHTHFLPRYDEDGRMVAEGHALAAEAGIACLLRRTYRAATEPAPEGAYDFVTYFECADDDVPVFHAVCAALRDVRRNPEWRFVREGPTWEGRRVARWEDLW